MLGVDINRILKFLCLENSEVIKRKLDRFSQFLGVTPDAFVSNRINDNENFSNVALDIFRESPAIFRTFLYKIFDVRVRYYIEERFHKTNFKDDEPLENLFPRKQFVDTFDFLESETGLIFPSPIISTFSFFVQTALLVIPALLVIVFLFTNVEFLLVLHGLVKVGAIVFFVILPYMTTILIFPKLFKPSKLPKFESYRDLIKNLVLTNQYAFIEHDYRVTKQELEKLFDSDFLQASGVEFW